MTTAFRFPQLGDSPAQFRQRLGPPRQSADIGLGVMRRYACTGSEIAVFFASGCAVAIHCAYATPPGWPVRDGGLRPTDFDASDQPRVLVADGGWVVATPTCPQAYIRLLSLA